MFIKLVIDPRPEILEWYVGKVFDFAVTIKNLLFMYTSKIFVNAIIYEISNSRYSIMTLTNGVAGFHVLE